MEMNVFPFAVLTMPNSGLFHGGSRRFAVDDFLRQTNIRNDTNISNNADMWPDHGGLNRRTAPAWQIEVVLMKIQSID